MDSHSSLVGYCPQEDALDDLVTVEEHLYFYARVHGIPEKDIKEVSTHAESTLLSRLLLSLPLLSWYAWKRQCVLQETIVMPL